MRNSVIKNALLLSNWMSLKWYWNYGEDYSGSYWKTPKRRCNYLSQPTWVRKGKVLLNKHNLLLRQVYPLSWPRWLVVVIFLDFSKSFNTVSYSILDKMPSIQPGKGMMQWVSSWLMRQAQRVVINRVTSGWLLVTIEMMQSQFSSMFSSMTWIKDYPK